MNIPKHIAIIPDGNRRWAKQKGLLAFFGHKEGAKATEQIMHYALDLQIPYLSFWGASVGNVTKRDSLEVKVLFEIIEEYFKKLAIDKEVHARQVKINAFGAWRQYFSESSKKAIEEAVEATKHYSNFTANFLLAYSGYDEMQQTVVKISEQKQQNPGLEITKDLIKENLFTAGMPPVDLVIRTGGEPHFSSGFMMWDVGDAQLYFTETLWPAFSKEEFKKAVDEFGERERRMGK
jgi:undecaprenyl diphosphate synthase